MSSPTNHPVSQADAREALDKLIAPSCLGPNADDSERYEAQAEDNARVETIRRYIAQGAPEGQAVAEVLTERSKRGATEIVLGEWVRAYHHVVSALPIDPRNLTRDCAQPMNLAGQDRWLIERLIREAGEGDSAREVLNWLRCGGWEVLQDPKYWTVENRFDGAIAAARADVAAQAAAQDSQNAIAPIPRAEAAGVRVPDERVVNPAAINAFGELCSVDAWNACRAEVLRLNANPPPPQDEVARLREEILSERSKRGSTEIILGEWVRAYHHIVGALPADPRNLTCDYASPMNLAEQDRWRVERLIREASPELNADAVYYGGECPAGANDCPITGLPFFSNIEHPDLGIVATYGGPFDSFTIPALADEDNELRRERYDHDRGHWIEGGEPVGYCYDEQRSEHPATGAGDAVDSAPKHGDDAGDGLRYVLCQVGFAGRYANWLLIPHAAGQYVTAAKLQPFSMAILTAALPATSPSLPYEGATIVPRDACNRDSCTKEQWESLIVGLDFRAQQSAACWLAHGAAGWRVDGGVAFMRSDWMNSGNWRLVANGKVDEYRKLPIDPTHTRSDGGS